jgi:N-glycosylase/DNA lyase
LNRYAGCRGNWRSGWAYGIQPDGVDLTLRRLEHLEQRVLTSRAYCSFWRAIAEGLRIRVLDLETLIAIQEELGGEKDRAVLPILRRTLEEKRKIQ